MTATGQYNALAISLLTVALADAKGGLPIIAKVVFGKAKFKQADVSTSIDNIIGWTDRHSYQPKTDDNPGPRTRAVTGGPVRGVELFENS